MPEREKRSGLSVVRLHLMVLCTKGHLRMISLYQNNLKMEQKNHTNLHTKVPEHPLRDFCLLIVPTLYAAILPDQTDILLPPLYSSKCNLINRSSCIHFFHLLMSKTIRTMSAIIVSTFVKILICSIVKPPFLKFILTMGFEKAILVKGGWGFRPFLYSSSLVISSITACMSWIRTVTRSMYSVEEGFL